jgi:hypothetical protein
LAVDGDTDEHSPTQSPSPLRQLWIAARRSPVQPETQEDTFAPDSVALHVARQVRASVRAARMQACTSVPQPSPHVCAWLGVPISAMLKPTITTIGTFFMSFPPFYVWTLPSSPV